MSNWEHRPQLYTGFRPFGRSPFFRLFHETIHCCFIDCACRDSYGMQAGRHVPPGASAAAGCGRAFLASCIFASRNPRRGRRAHNRYEPLPLRAQRDLCTTSVRHDGPSALRVPAGDYRLYVVANRHADLGERTEAQLAALTFDYRENYDDLPMSYVGEISVPATTETLTLPPVEVRRRVAKVAWQYLCRGERPGHCSQIRMPLQRAAQG